MKTLLVAFLLSLSSLFAQAVILVAATPPATIAGCGTATTPVTGFCVFGPTGGPFSLAINGGAGWQVIGGGTGVTSFNGLTGPVTSSTANIKYSDLVSPPTTINCGNGPCIIK